ncbi:MAG: DUF192 domain-containing protein [Halodesulfurarchaeum sp.]
MDRGHGVVVGLALVVVALAMAGPQVGVGGDGAEETTRLTVLTNEGTGVEIRAQVADSPTERFVGLSDTHTLGPDEGMVFVYPDTDQRAFVMREMAFPLDIVFVDGNRTITAIHHAAADADGRFTGRARWVIEVNRGWTAENGVAVGDQVRGLPR